MPQRRAGLHAGPGGDYLGWMQTPVPSPTAVPSPAPRAHPSRWGAWGVVLLLLCWAAYLYFGSRAPAPPSDPPRRDSGVVRESHVGGRGSRSMEETYVELEIFTGERLMEVRAPYGLALLGEIPQPGDSVVVWTTPRGGTRRVWQMEVNGRQVFSLAQARRAIGNRRSFGRSLAVLILGAAVLMAVIAVLTPMPASVRPPEPRASGRRRGGGADCGRPCGAPPPAQARPPKKPGGG